MSYKAERPRERRFVECDTCRAKPGTPALCYGCLHNRAAMEKWDNYALAQWCAGFNAGVDNALENLYHRRLLRYWRYHLQAMLNPALRYEGWRWWKFWPANR